MNRYALFLLTDKLSDDCKAKIDGFVKRVLRAEVATTHRLSEACKVFTSFVSLALDQENENVGSGLAACWKLLPTDGHEKLQNLISMLSDSCTYSNIPDLVQAVHCLCDSLQRPGPQVELFWLRSDAYETCDDDIELYGCLKRLQLWHNAIVSIIIPNDFGSSSHGASSHHFDSLRPTVLSLDEALSTYKRPAWNGSIAVAGSAQSVQLPGFRLDACEAGEFLDVVSPPDDVVTQNKGCFETGTEGDVVVPSSCMKFVASVNISDVPIIYISSVSYKLSLTSRSSVLQQSDNFLNVLKDAENVGYILRLEYGFCPEETEMEERVAGRESKTRKSWNDFLKEQYNSGYDDLTSSGEFERTIGSHSFLVCAVSSEDLSLFMSQPSTQESKEIVFLAYRLRNPSELNGSPMHRLNLRSLEKSTDEDDILDLIDHLSDQRRSVVDHLDRLPNFSTKAFIKLTCNLHQAQLLAVQRLAGEDEMGRISGVELTRVLSEVRAVFLESIRSKPHSLKEHCSMSETKYQLQSTLMPEYRFDPYLQPERQILMLKASDSITSAQSKSFLHSGTLATLSPPTNNQVVVTLDATEMLKYFNPDGSAVASESLVKVPIKKRRQRLYHYDRGEARSLPWPECARARYHDVYYNIAVSEELEKKCQQLRGRLGSQETSSTFGPAQTFLLPAKAGNDRSKQLPSFPGHRRALDRRNASTKIETKTEKSTKLESSVLSRRTSTEVKVSQREMDSFADSNSCDSNSQLLRGESRSQRNRRRLEEVIREMLETTYSIGPTDPLFKPCFKRLYTITEAFVRDLPTSRDLRENMTKIASSHARQTVKFERDRQKKLPASNGKNSQK